jgi:glycosyltransferase involved in cell wall biosynthesis
MKKPLISVIVPVLNEAAYIEAMVCSLLKQKQENISMELLLVDGGSTDGTLEKLNVLTPQYPFINIIHNERHITPVAFNKGLAAAKGDYIAILGAHSKYDEDYLETCIAEMQQHNVEGCSGRVIIAGDNAKGEAALVYCLLTSNFGVSSKSYRTANEGISEQCPYPVFKRCVFDKVGFYNEDLPRNQDNDMNYRIRKAGYKLYYSFKTSACYYHPQTISGLLRYALRTGKGNAMSLKISPASMSLRHVIPMLFTAFLLVLICCLLFGLLLPGNIELITAVALISCVGIHLFCGVIQSLQFYRQLGTKDVWKLPGLFLVFHFVYGWGMLVGLMTNKR